MTSNAEKADDDLETLAALETEAKEFDKVSPSKYTMVTYEIIC